MADLIPMLAAAAGASVTPTGYQIERSLRFNSVDNALLIRTPASTTNRRTWTWSGWVKRSTLVPSGLVGLFSACDASTINHTYIGFNNDRLVFTFGDGTYSIVTDAVYRDLSAWYHIVFAFDSTQATAANREKIYVNGNQVTAITSVGVTGGYVPQNYDGYINTNNEHGIGTRIRPDGTRTSYFPGYLADIHFVDGQALTPSNFGETDATTGVWKPKAYAGTYGTNGFYLDFSDNSSTAALGTDSSGNGNTWSTGGFSVTAGIANDSLVDTPTPYGTDTGAGGEVRGNYATWNPLDKGSDATILNGNLQVTTAASGGRSVVSTIAFDIATESIYCELTLNATSSTFGIISIQNPDVANYIGYSSTGYGYSTNGQIYNNNSGSSYGATYTTNDVIGMAVGSGSVTFYKNGSSQGVAFSGLTGKFYVAVGALSMNNYINFGQRPFAHAAPSGFKALCTTNLPDPTIVQGDDYFNTVLYTGNGSTQSITGVGFQPDWVWIKTRSNALSHCITDSVRGTNLQLASNSTAADQSTTDGITSFDSDGFSLGAGTQQYSSNTNTYTYAAWNWNAGGSNATNTDGTITSTVRANPTAGISIVTYTGNGGNASATIGHGLGVAPKMIILKFRNATSAWSVYHASLGNTKRLTLNTTDGEGTSTNYWNDTSPTSTVFSVGQDFNQATVFNYVTYCFAEVEGFSKFGSYTGNGSADGPFVYTGFRPAFVFVKRTDTTGQWFLWDSVRTTYNIINKELFAQVSDAEFTADKLDFLSNGFKMRTTGVDNNASGGTYIYAAFAENPFKYALAR